MCTQEQISGKSLKFYQSLEECALSKGLLLSGHCFRRDPASSHHSQEERNVVWHSTAKENSHLLHQETSAGRQHQCHQFGAFAALAAVDIEADGTLLNVHMFLTQCLHSANNGNKSPIFRAVNKAAHYSERENQQYEKAVPYVTT